MAFAHVALLLATLNASSSFRLIPTDGAAVPVQVEVEWLGPDSTALTAETLPVANGMITPGTPPPRAEALRVVGPNVVSWPLPYREHAGIRLLPAGTLHLDNIPRASATIRVFLILADSDLEYSREIPTSGLPTSDLAVPLGTYSVAVDIGSRYVVSVFSGVTIGARSTVRLSPKSSVGKSLDLRVKAREDGTPIAGARIAETPTPDLPRVFWRALAARCRTSTQSGELSCGAVPPELRAIDVIAPARRRGHVAIVADAAQSDPPPALEIKLARYQNVAITTTLPSGVPPALVKGLAAYLVRCQEPPCDASKALRKDLGSRSRIEFPHVEPGVYRTWLQGDAAHSAAVRVVVADYSDARDTLTVPLQLELWHLVGSTRLKDGTGVPAKIQFGILREGEQQQEEGGSVDSDATGMYESFLLAPAGVNVWAWATSEKPAAEGVTPPPGVKLLEGDDRVPLDIELSSSGAVIKLVDKETNAAIPDCLVTLHYWGERSGGVRGLKSDAEGTVHWLGIDKGSFLARAMCDGYRPAATEKLDLSNVTQETTLKLDPVGPIRLRVTDANGSPLPGARVFLEQSTFQNAMYPFQIPAEFLGVTDFDGEIAIPLRPRPGFYVVAQGHALYVGVPMPCAIKTGCTEAVHLARPSAFPGIRVRNTKGEPESAAWLLFSKEGVPIPVSIQGEVVNANQTGRPQHVIVQEGDDTIHLLPALFGPGTYDLEYGRPRAGSPPERIPLAHLSLPTSQRLELIVPASPAGQ